MKHADHWFYVPDSISKIVSFPNDEAVHAVKVLRLEVGDGIQWLDGKGGRFIGKVKSITKRSLIAEVVSSTNEQSVSPTILAVGQLHDANRMEWMVEKATELGVTEIILLASNRVERTRYKLSRLEAKVISAVKQSGRAYVPQIREAGFAEALKDCQQLNVRYIAHCYKTLERNESWKAVPQGQSVCLFIGPEGDFTQQEVQEAEQEGLQSISLGDTRLRTETAALAGLVRLRL